VTTEICRCQDRQHHVVRITDDSIHLFRRKARAHDEPKTHSQLSRDMSVKTSVADNNQIGSSGLAGGHTKVLFADPAKAGFSSILLFVPAHTTILAHSHRDDRIATVASGEWHFGYGDHFDLKQLKTLSQGSVYSEPGGHNLSPAPKLAL
jgi:hypothetical protein